jgi:hypothetical protein
MPSPRSLLVAALALACGPIPAPPQATDLREHPRALREAFERAAGAPRLVLLLSPG